MMSYLKGRYHLLQNTMLTIHCTSYLIHGRYADLLLAPRRAGEDNSRPPSQGQRLQDIALWLIQIFYFHMDPEPIFHFNEDMDSVFFMWILSGSDFHSDADSDPTFYSLDPGSNQEEEQIKFKTQSRLSLPFWKKPLDFFMLPIFHFK